MYKQLNLGYTYNIGYRDSLKPITQLEITTRPYLLGQINRSLRKKR